MENIIDKINYLGYSLCAKKEFRLLSNDEFLEIKSQWYEKPERNKVLLEMMALRETCQFANITKYYFRDVMDDTIKYYDKWSINQVFEHIPLLSYFINKIEQNPKVFCDDSIIGKLDTCFRLGGKGCASKVAQFPIKYVDDILYKYNVNNNYYDFSCGWGARLGGAMKNNVNYFGTDPNYKLVERLNLFANDFNGIVNARRNESLVDIRCQGSEIFIPEWEDKIGVAFSSPPYFNLEDYKTGNQSYKKGITSYNSWLKDYLYKTIENIYKYLVHNGYFIINIKDFDKYFLEKDTIEIAEQIGFTLFSKEVMEQTSSRVVEQVNDLGGTQLLDSAENMFVFIKKGVTPKQCYDLQLTFDI